ncbi:hypothetical protein [Labrenzia sp. CE80]|uniref:hypothetical protein n=1 Tax=Labrenzia sp. CE80 TaxID=1788986 RepID=UPI00129BCFE7|nr:hypothetical protein [Labrenzia sp. CE80]
MTQKFSFLSRAKGTLQSALVPLAQTAFEAIGLDLDPALLSVAAVIVSAWLVNAALAGVKLLARKLRRPGQ